MAINLYDSYIDRYTSNVEILLVEIKRYWIDRQLDMYDWMDRYRNFRTSKGT